MHQCTVSRLDHTLLLLQRLLHVHFTSLEAAVHIGFAKGGVLCAVHAASTQQLHSPRCLCVHAKQRLCLPVRQIGLSSEMDARLEAKREGPSGNTACTRAVVRFAHLHGALRDARLLNRFALPDDVTCRHRRNAERANIRRLCGNTQ